MGLTAGVSSIGVSSITAIGVTGTGAVEGTGAASVTAVETAAGAIGLGSGFFPAPPSAAG